MNLEDLKVTTSHLWEGAVLFAAFDVVLVFCLVRRSDRDSFVRLKPFLLTFTGVFWYLLWTAMCIYFWDPVYRYVFPVWARWVIPPVYAVLFTVIALLFWWISLRLPGRPALTFCLLGGLWGTATHLWGMSRGLIDKPPMLQGVSPVSVAVMPIFEFVFYWCVILFVSAFASQHLRRGASF